MYRYNRTFIIRLVFVMLTMVTLQAMAKTSTLAGTAPAAKLGMTSHTSGLALFNPAESTTGATPEIREQTPRRAYTVVQTKRMVARLRPPAGSASFQLTISTTLPITTVLTPLSVTLQHQGQAMPLSSFSVQGTGRAVLTGTIQSSTQEWVVDVDKLPTEPSTSVGLSMTSPVGRITGVTVDPVVQVDQTAYSVTVASTHPMTVTLTGYAARKVWPNTSADGCEGMTMTWQAAPGQSAAAPVITQVITQSSLGGVSGAENQCEAKGVASLNKIVASGRYTYTLQAIYHTAYGDFTNQAQTLLDVTVPPKPPVISVFDADPPEFARGALEAITLTWQTENADSVTLEPGLGTVELSGSRSVSAPTQDTTYRLKASGPGGETARQVSVQVTEPPDTTAPTVTIAKIAPDDDPTTNDEITFMAEAADAQSGIDRIEIWVNDVEVQSCVGETVCRFVGGSYAAGELRYQAVAFDQAQNRAVTPIQTLLITEPPDTIKPTVTAVLHHADSVKVVAFSPDGKFLATAANDSTARLWDPITGKEVARIEHENDWLDALIFSPDGQLAVTAASGGEIRVWSPATRIEIAHWNVDGVGNIHEATFSQDGQQLAMVFNDGTARIYVPTTGEELARFPNAFHSVALSPDGQLLAAADSNQTAHIWNLVTGDEVARLQHNHWILKVVFSPDGQLIATASFDGTARLWNARTGEEVTRFQHGGPVRDVVFSLDGQIVATASDDSTARLWQTATGTEVARLQHQGSVNIVTFSPDGRWVATASDDTTARLWESNSGKAVARLQHEHWVRGIVFSPDQHFLATRTDGYGESAGNDAYLWSISQPPNANTGATVTGRVLWNNTPLEGIEITIENARSTVSDANGKFRFENAPIGKFWVGTNFTETPPIVPYWNVAREITIAANQFQDIGVLGVSKFLRPISPAEDEQLTTNTPVLKWEPVANAIQYNVFIRAAQDDDQSVIVREVTNNTEFQVTTPLSNGTYVWFVDAMGDPLEPGGFYTTLASTPQTVFTVTETIPTPELVFSGTEAYEANGRQWLRFRLAVANWGEFPVELFAPAPDLPPCGLNTNSSRTWVNIHNAQDDRRIYGFCGLSAPENLNSIWFAVEQGHESPKAVYIVLDDRKTGNIYRSNIVSLP